MITEAWVKEILSSNEDAETVTIEITTQEAEELARLARIGILASRLGGSFE